LGNIGNPAPRHAVNRKILTSTSKSVMMALSLILEILADQNSVASLVSWQMVLLGAINPDDSNWITG
jgi:hypothetical protein